MDLVELFEDFSHKPEPAVDDSTPEEIAPYESRDLGLMLAGSIPAAMLKSSDLPHWKDAIEQNGWKVFHSDNPVMRSGKVVRGHGFELYFVTLPGEEYRAEQLKKIYDFGGPRSYADHIRISRLLGHKPTQESVELAENDYEHTEAYHNTGRWGKQGAGCIFLARTTGRILVPHRSHAVLEPGTWGVWGGAVDQGESPEEAVRREVSEEAGYHGHYDMIPLYVFKENSFRYSNFLVVVDDEFTPELNWETQGYEWCEYGHWPRPMHFGLKALLSDPASVARIKRVLGS